MVTRKRTVKTVTKVTRQRPPHKPKVRVPIIKKIQFTVK